MGFVMLNNMRNFLQIFNLCTQNAIIHIGEYMIYSVHVILTILLYFSNLIKLYTYVVFHILFNAVPVHDLNEGVSKSNSQLQIFQTPFSEKVFVQQMAYRVNSK